MSVTRPEQRIPATAPGSLIENAVSVAPLPSAGADCFTNAHPLWLPPTARGIYGGTFISQCISAAQATVAEDFVAYSIHTTFIRAGTPDKPLIYHVSRTSDGNNFAVRAVKCVQNSQVTCSAIVSLTRQGPTNKPLEERRSKHISHAEPMPQGIPRPPSDASITDAESAVDSRPTHHRGAYLTRRLGITRCSPPPH